MRSLRRRIAMNENGKRQEATAQRAAAKAAPVEGQGFSPDNRTNAKHRTFLPEAVAKPAAQRQIAARRAAGICQQDAPRTCSGQAGATTSKRVSNESRCFGVQLLEDTRSRHRKSVNFSRFAKTGPSSASTRQSCRIELTATHSKQESSFFLLDNFPKSARRPVGGRSLSSDISGQRAALTYAQLHPQQVFPAFDSSI